MNIGRGSSRTVSNWFCFVVILVWFCFSTSVAVLNLRRCFEPPSRSSVPMSRLRAQFIAWSSHSATDAILCFSAHCSALQAGKAASATRASVGAGADTWGDTWGGRESDREAGNVAARRGGRGRAKGDGERQTKRQTTRRATQTEAADRKSTNQRGQLSDRERERQTANGRE